MFKNKKTSKILKYISAKKIVILGFVFGLVLGLGIMSTQIPEQIAKLSDGSESIAVFEKDSLSSNELFTKLKGLTNISAVLDIIDAKLLESEYPYQEYYDAALAQAQEQLAYAKENKVSETEFLSHYGFMDYDSFVKYLTLEGQRYAYYQKYLKTQISEKDMTSYYKNKVFGDIYSQYVAVKAVEDTATDETLIQEILTKVKNGASFEDVKELYSKNENVAFGDLGYVSFDKNIDPNYIKTLINIKDNSFSDKIIATTDFGYTIIFRKDQLKKEKYEEIDTVIQGVLMGQLDSSEENLYIKTFINMRKNAKLKFTDTDFNKQYKEYIKSYK